jgi:hypothetical protein
MSKVENKSDEVIRNFDSDTLRDLNLRGAIILQKNMTSADVLDAYLNGMDAIPIDLNKETKNDIQSN